MAIVFNNVLFENEKNRINFQTEKNQVVGLINFDMKEIFKKNIKDGKITINRYVLNTDSKEEKKNKIMSFIAFNYDMPYSLYVIDVIKNYIKDINNERLNELLKVFDLKDEVLNKLYIELSTSEINKINIIIVLLSEKEILYLEEPTNNLDDKVIDKLIRELKRLKKNKTILIHSTDTNFLIRIVDTILLKTTSSKYLFDNKYEVLKSDKVLKDIGLHTPYIMYFIDKVYKIKGIKLGYRDNLNDTIKDVYRHV